MLAARGEIRAQQAVARLTAWPSTTRRTSTTARSKSTTKTSPKKYPDTRLAARSAGRIEDVQGQTAPCRVNHLQWLVDVFPESKKTGSDHRRCADDFDAEVSRYALRIRRTLLCGNGELRGVDMKCVPVHFFEPSVTVARFALLLLYRRLRRLPVRQPVALSARHPDRLRADLRVGQLPPQPGRTADRGRDEGNRNQDALQGRQHAQRRQRAHRPDRQRHQAGDRRRPERRSAEDRSSPCVVQVSWIDRKGDLVGQARPCRCPPTWPTSSNTGKLVPEVGQSVATAAAAGDSAHGRADRGADGEPPW